MGLRNRQASGRHTEVRLAIAQAYVEAGDSLAEPSPEAQVRRAALASRIAALGNAENESYGIELGYAYRHSPIVCAETDAEISDDHPHDSAGRPATKRTACRRQRPVRSAGALVHADRLWHGG